VGTTVLDHDGPFTERDFLELAPESGHVELVEGTLLVGPTPGAEHAAAVAAVRAALESALPEGLRVAAAVPLKLGHDCVLVPDLVVARAAEPADGAPEPAPETREVLGDGDVLIVVDVVDRTHGIVHRSFKPQLYARSRIPYAVLVDAAAPAGSASMLIGGRYHEFAQAGPGEKLLFEEPFRVEIDLAALAEKAPADDQ
jgi:hypothetical protein